MQSLIKGWVNQFAEYLSKGETRQWMSIYCQRILNWISTSFSFCQSWFHVCWSFWENREKEGDQKRGHWFSLWSIENHSTCVTFNQQSSQSETCSAFISKLSRNNACVEGKWMNREIETQGLLIRDALCESCSFERSEQKANSQDISRLACPVVSVVTVVVSLNIVFYEEECHSSSHPSQQRTCHAVSLTEISVTLNETEKRSERTVLLLSHCSLFLLYSVSFPLSRTVI